MIVLHSVTKELGRGDQKKLVLDEIDLVIPPRSHLVILGQSGSGKTTLLGILSGMLSPTSGWVERRAVVSATLGLVRYGSALTTPRQLAHRLSKLYRADEREISHFIERFADLEEVMDMPIKFLAGRIWQKLNLALFYALPCDFYLFDGAVGTRIPDLKERCREACERRREQAGMILATSAPKVAREFGGTGGILFRGKLTFFESLEQAIAVFEQLMIDHPVVVSEPRQRKRPLDDE